MYQIEKALLALLIALTSVVLAGCATGGGEVARTPPPDCVPANDTLIVPGCRIGPVALGLKPADLLNTLGSPNSSMIQSTKTPDLNHIYHYDDFTVFVNTVSGLVSWVFTYSPSYATAEGIRVGVSELEVRVKLGAPDNVSKYNRDSQTYFYRSRGLHVRFNPNAGMRVTNLSVGAPH